MENVNDIVNNFQVLSILGDPKIVSVKCLDCLTVFDLNVKSWWKKKNVKIKTCCRDLNVKDRAARLLYSQYKTNASRRNLKFELTLEVFCNIIYRNCHYCNRQGNLRPDSVNKNYVMLCGVDRKEPKIGYDEENCVPCCTECNRAKRDMSYDEFLSWLKDVSVHAVFRVL